MKYLITESQFDKAIFKYLDNQDLYKIEDRGDYYFWKSKESWNRNDYTVISAFHKRKDCFVGSDLLSEISSFFSLDLESALSIISKWVETKVDFEITYPYSDYGAD
jgi:hypothetical protein